MMSDNTALEHALDNADLRAIVADLYPDSGANTYQHKQRIKAVWRGGDGYNVGLNAKTARDFKSSETYNSWTFLTDVAGYSKEDAAAYLLDHYGNGEHFEKAARRREAHAKSSEAREQEAKAKRLAEALEVQRTANTEGVSAYLERKGVASVLASHKVALARLPNGETVPGLVYAEDEHGAFMQFVLHDLSGKITGYQRIYDGERGKQFVYGSKPKGAVVLLEPKDQRLPKTGDALAGLLQDGYEVAICEGVATGASIAMARPKTFVFCALSAGNLEAVAEALRDQYGYTRQLETSRGTMQKAIDVCIWADFDRSTTGQTAAHLAALRYDCHVRMPKFRGGYGDFNDLHAARGLEAVKRTRRQTPDVTLAHNKELSKQRLSADKYLAPINLPERGAALIVRAPQESGKTHRLAELLEGSTQHVLVVTHRESLAKHLAARLHFECYQDYPAHMLRDIPRLVICFDSLQKLAIGGTLPAYDLLVLDESEQVLEHVTGKHIKRKAANFGVLEHLLGHAPRIICADANAGKLTADTLQRCNPERRISWQRHEYHIAVGRRMHFVQSRDDALDALEHEQRPVWYASDSLRQTRDLSAYLDDPQTLTINSETATTDAAAAYLLDPTSQAAAHRRMVASPSVQTGLSDDSDHWQHVIASFGGYTSTPPDALQAMMRARRVQEVTVHATKGRSGAVSVQEALEGAAAADDFEAHALDQDSYGAANATYERLRAEVEAQRTGRQTRYRERLVLEAARLGYSITYDVPQDIGAATLEARGQRREALKEAGLERYVHDRVSAERINEATAKRLEDAYTLAQPERFALEQYQLRAFYRLPDDVSSGKLGEMLRLDDYKTLRRKVEAYEHFTEPREVAELRARGELEGGLLKGDAKAHMLRHEYHRRLGEVVGLDSATESAAEAWQRELDEITAELEALEAEANTAQTRRKGEINRQIRRLETRRDLHHAKTFTTRYSADSESVRAFVRWSCKHFKALSAAHLITCTADELKRNPVAAIGDSLRRCGLEHSADTRKAGKSFAITFVSVSAMRNYSRPRRENWHSARQTVIKTLDNDLPRKNAVLASQTATISPCKNTNSEHETPPPDDHVPEAVSWPTDSSGARIPAREVPGYDALYHYVRVNGTGKARHELLRYYGMADSGDAAALNAICNYLSMPQVQALLSA